MPRPGDVLSRVVERTQADGVTAVPSLVTADFTLTGFKDGVSQAITYSYTWISGKKYKLNYTLPSVKGLLDIFQDPASGTDKITPRWLTGYVARNDLDSIAAVNRPAVIASPSVGIGQDFPITLTVNTYDEIEATAYEADLVTPVDFSGWNNWRFEVHNLDQSVETNLPATFSAGITADANGLIFVPILENSVWFSTYSAAFAQSGRQLRYTLIGDQASNTAKSRCVLRGGLTLTRREGTS